MVKTISLGGSASHIQLAKVGHGTMLMTWAPTPTPDAQAFEAIKAGIDAIPAPAKALLNCGEFYGAGLSNIKLVVRFLKAHPEYTDRVFLSVKGALGPNGEMVPDCGPANVRRSVEAVVKALEGTKKLDLFQCARMDGKTPVEEVMGTLKDLIEEGLFDYVGLSEVSADTLRRAAKVYPVTIVEIEVSLWSYEEQTKKVIAAAAELGTVVAAYSPIGRGFLSGEIKSLDDLPEGDMRRRMTRFQPENFEQNLQLVSATSALAKQKGVSPAQLAIAWVCSLGEKVVPIPGSSKATKTVENLKASEVVLSEQEKKEIEAILEGNMIKGSRYFDGMTEKQLHLWG